MITDKYPERVMNIKFQNLEDKDLNLIIAPHLLASKGLLPKDFEHVIVSNDRDYHFHMSSESEYKFSQYKIMKFNIDEDLRIWLSPFYDRTQPTLREKLKQHLETKNDYISKDASEEDKEKTLNMILNSLKNLDESIKVEKIYGDDEELYTAVRKKLMYSILISYHSDVKYFKERFNIEIDPTIIVLGFKDQHPGITFNRFVDSFTEDNIIKVINLKDKLEEGWEQTKIIIKTYINKWIEIIKQ